MISEKVWRFVCVVFLVFASIDYFWHHVKVYQSADTKVVEIARGQQPSVLNKPATLEETPPIVSDSPITENGKMRFRWEKGPPSRVVTISLFTDAWIPSFLPNTSSEYAECSQHCKFVDQNGHVEADAVNQLLFVKSVPIKFF